MSNSPNRNNRRKRETVGTFIDIGDGIQFLLTDEEIAWINKSFLIMQMARDEFVVKVSVQSNVSPKKIQERERERS